MYVVAPCWTHLSRIIWPSTYRRTPSSDRSTVNLYVASSATGTDLVHRAEKLSAGTPSAGAPPPQVKSMASSWRVRAGEPESVRFAKYSAAHPPSAATTSPIRSYVNSARASPPDSKYSTRRSCGPPVTTLSTLKASLPGDHLSITATLST